MFVLFVGICGSSGGVGDGGTLAQAGCHRICWWDDIFSRVVVHLCWASDDPLLLQVLGGPMCREAFRSAGLVGVLPFFFAWDESASYGIVQGFAVTEKKNISWSRIKIYLLARIRRIRNSA